MQLKVTFDDQICGPTSTDTIELN